MLSPKSPAPAFSLPSTSGRTVSTKDLRGKRFVLYFYPKDDTPGCTKEACDFRDNLARLGSAGIDVYGVSKDGLASHEKFRAKYGLPFDLLSDEGNAVARSYGAFGEKLMYGKPVTGVIRSTFLIGADGKVERVWSPVRVEGHVDAVLAAVRGEADPSASKRGANAATKRGAAGTIVPPRAAAAKKPAGSSSAAKSGSKSKTSTTSGASRSTTSTKPGTKKATRSGASSPATKKSRSKKS